ncbi:MAG: hypothetical protein WCE49_07890 [Terrimicrobiaceae bacterium]
MNRHVAIKSNRPREEREAGSDPHASFFSWFEPDPTGLIFEIGYKRFETPQGVRGLACVPGDRLDILSVEASAPGCGQFRRFIASAKEAFSTIAIWEDWNPLIGEILERYGFQRARSLYSDGSSSDGWKWTKDSGVIFASAG